MNIKEKIGQRIKQERLSKGLTRKALSELTETLKASRINNYERGDRTPGPQEIKELAKVLEVSASYLMCLTDDNTGKINRAPHFGALIPLLDYQQACHAIACIQEMKAQVYSGKDSYTLIHPELASRIGKHAFAVEVKDESMMPECRLRDCLIIDPDAVPNPGDFVAARLADAHEIIIRKYKQISADKTASEFELIALNSDWAGVKIGAGIHGELIGTVVNLTRVLKW